MNKGSNNRKQMLHITTKMALTHLVGPPYPVAGHQPTPKPKPSDTDTVAQRRGCLTKNGGRLQPTPP